MTVMLLQRSDTIPLTNSQKTTDNNSNEPPFLIILEIQKHVERQTNNYNNYSNNNINNSVTRTETVHKNCAIIGRSSTCEPGTLFYTLYVS
jgi:hypothetical protein